MKVMSRNWLTCALAVCILYSQTADALEETPGSNNVADTTNSAPETTVSAGVFQTTEYLKMRRNLEYDAPTSDGLDSNGSVLVGKHVSDTTVSEEDNTTSNSEVTMSLGQNIAPESLKTAAYHYELTIAVLTQSSTAPVDCSLIIKYAEGEIESELSRLSLKMPVHQVSTMQDMMDILDICLLLDSGKLQSTTGELPEMSAHGMMRSFASGIVPGTKWCGLGHKAENYQDLGENQSLDVCCRAHDFCPVKLKRWKSGFGLFNWALYSRSHCDCDQQFYSCLKSVNSSISNTVGAAFFNYVKVSCIEELSHQTYEFKSATEF